MNADDAAGGNAGRRRRVKGARSAASCSAFAAGAGAGLAAAAAVVGLGLGHPSSGLAPSMAGPGTPAAPRAPVAPAAPVGSAAPDARMLAAAEPRPVTVPVTPKAPRAEQGPAGRGRADGAEACAGRLTLAAVPPAMIAVELVAPCHQGAEVALRHAGLAISARLSADGRLGLALPAVDTAGAVSASVAGGPVLRGAAPVPDLGAHDRVAVLWQQPGALRLAAPAEDAPPGGVLTLGDAAADWPLLAAVHTLPAADRPPGARAGLRFEALVTPGTCGRDLLAEIIRVRGGAMTRTALHLEMPDCAAVGEAVGLDALLADPGPDR